MKAYQSCSLTEEKQPCYYLYHFLVLKLKLEIFLSPSPSRSTIPIIHRSKLRKTTKKPGIVIVSVVLFVVCIWTIIVLKSDLSPIVQHYDIVGTTRRGKWGKGIRRRRRSVELLDTVSLSIDSMIWCSLYEHMCCHSVVLDMKFGDY